MGDTSVKVARPSLPAGARASRHTAAVIGLESQFGPGRIGFDTHFAAPCPTRLRAECRDLLVDEDVGALLTSPPRLPSGRVDSFGLGALGRPRGLEYFVIGTLNGLTFQDEKTGFWCGRARATSCAVAMRLEIVDSASGTKLLDDALTRRWSSTRTATKC